MPKIEIDFKKYYPSSATFYEYFTIIQALTQNSDELIQNLEIQEKMDSNPQNDLYSA